MAPVQEYTAYLASIHTAPRPFLEWKFPRPSSFHFQCSLFVSLIGILGGGAETIFGLAEKGVVCARVHSEPSWLESVTWCFELLPNGHITRAAVRRRHIQTHQVSDYTAKHHGHLTYLWTLSSKQSFSPLSPDTYSFVQYFTLDPHPSLYLYLILTL
jgi:hypothetical protein